MNHQAPEAPALAEPKGDILIGNLQDESGGMKALSSALTFAATMKIEEINAAGGINGRMLKLVTYDTRSDVNEAINAYHRMVEQDKVAVVLDHPLPILVLRLPLLQKNSKSQSLVCSWMTNAPSRKMANPGLICSWPRTLLPPRHNHRCLCSE